MRIPSGKIDQNIYFVAVDATDLKTRKTGLTTWTVYRSRNGGAATIYTTPTIVELSAANMPGEYALLIDEDTTIASTSDSEEYIVSITQASMARVTRVVELFRRDSTSGRTQTVDASGRVDVGSLLGTAVATPATAGVMDVNVKNAANVAWGSGAITNAAFAADAISATKVNADVGNEFADSLLDRTAGVETGLTIRQAMRLIASALFGKSSGLATTTGVFRDIGDTKNRISATIDADGNRSAVTLDAT
ncbi:hypothetical protein [Mesorhizobium huakuii]|uniref:Uncharacterized protein n=1 Tax=Mesorhizobium huakuii TaxID=28104 RepID=A0A7G6T0V3_9HYPH|nr:hypothetical protein [Mesorhizobium huakuii]QND60385.1 hypothetical protein HB778_30435 [Mesorhizobium huakuii]